MTTTTIRFPLSTSTICILVNGEPDNISMLQSRWASYDSIVICDGAWKKVTEKIDKTLYTNDPRIVVLGDGDSLTDEQKPTGFLYDSDQNSTDFEKAMKWILTHYLTHYNVTHGHHNNCHNDQSSANNDNQLYQKTNTSNINVDIYWANGGELDHTLGNLAMACQYAQQLTCHFYTDNQYFRYIQQDLIIHNAQGKKLSIFPFPHCTVQSTQGLLYPMTDYPMQVYSQQSLRNQIKENVAMVHIATSNMSNQGYILFIQL